jgi:GT2 family glycosyltransferase
VRQKAGDQIGWWDEDYFWYGEDLDFCYRLKEKDWQIFFVPKTKIIHYKGVASGMKKHSREVTTATKETKIRAARSSTQVMRVFYQKHYLDRYPKALAWLVMKGIDLLERVRLLKASL